MSTRINSGGRVSPGMPCHLRHLSPGGGRGIALERVSWGGRKSHLRPLPRRGGRGRIPSAAKRSEGIRVRGRSRESELADKPPHPICFASQGLRSQIDLSPQAGRGGASGARVAISKQRAICDCPAASGERWHKWHCRILNEAPANAIALPHAGRGGASGAAFASI